MGKILKRRQLFVWGVCFAILMNALAPSVCHAISAMRGQPPMWLEVCSSSGSKLFDAAINGDPNAGSNTDGAARIPGHAFEHCPFCFSHLDSVAPPPWVGLVPTMENAHPPFPKLFYLAPQPQFFWPAAQPRAPPAATVIL
jgi:hypothetical protein